MVNTKIVEGLKVIPKKPIAPAVKTKGSKFGINDITIIFTDLNIKAIKIAIKKIAIHNEKIRFFTKNSVPFKNKIDFPVNLTEYLLLGKISFIDCFNIFSISYILSVLISFMYVVTLAY